MDDADFLEAARKVLTYEPDTGHFYWLVRQGRCGAGMRAGNVRPDGHRQIKVHKVMVRSNRLAWLFMTGRWPPASMKVDHENRRPADDRWSNLRLATDAQNSANQNIRPDNTSGYPGVGLSKRTGRWSAYIHQRQEPGRKSLKIHLGSFGTKAEAIAARKAAETQYFGAFAPQHGDPENACPSQ